MFEYQVKDREGNLFTISCRSTTAAIDYCKAHGYTFIRVLDPYYYVPSWARP